MAKRGGAKEQLLREFITAFAITVGIKADKKAYNEAWRTLWQRINRIELFKINIYCQGKYGAKL